MKKILDRYCKQYTWTNMKYNDTLKTNKNEIEISAQILTKASGFLDS